MKDYEKMTEFDLFLKVFIVTYKIFTWLNYIVFTVYGFSFLVYYEQLPYFEQLLRWM